jgi:hypothetical protein
MGDYSIIASVISLLGKKPASRKLAAGEGIQARLMSRIPE